MPYRKQKFINNEIYHIASKRIEGRLFFKDIDDYYRGIFSIYEFNNSKSVTIQKRREARLRFKKGRGRVATRSVFTDDRDKLVEILVFCFMPNHIHLLLRQLKGKGISMFMQKVNGGYASYFKEKYDLQGEGYFLKGRFVSVPIKTDDQLKTVFAYIHTNPISLIEPNWKEKGIKNPEKVIKFLENYKWSSYPDYIGKKNFPSVTERNFMLEVLGGVKGCKNFVEDWIRHKAEIRKLIKKFPELFLE